MDVCRLEKGKKEARGEGQTEKGGEREWNKVMSSVQVIILR